MALDLTKIQALQQQVADTGTDLNNASSGGGDYVPPAEGAVRVRLVGYVELGVHTTSYKGAAKTKPRCELTFELSGPKHEPKILDDGRKVPHLIRITETIGTHEKNGYIKLFKLLNTDGQAKTFVDLLGKAWLANITHRKFKRTDGSDGVVANLRPEGGAYTFRPTTYEDPETNEARTVKVAPALTPLRLFLWDYADTDQWDSIFVDGTFDDGTTKNKVQEKIKSAENFVGSPIYNVLIEAGRSDELGRAAKTGPADDDAQGDDGEEATEAPPATTPAKPAAKPRQAASKAVPKPVAQDEDDADPLSGT